MTNTDELKRLAQELRDLVDLHTHAYFVVERAAAAILDLIAQLEQARDQNAGNAEQSRAGAGYSPGTTPPAGELPALPWEGPENGNDFEAWLEARDRFDIQAAFRAYARQAIAAQGAVTAGAQPESYKEMFQSAVSALADIDKLLGLPEDGCNDPQVTVSALADLMAGLKEISAVVQPVADDRTAFEDWYAPIFRGGEPANMLRRENGEYGSVQDQIAWMAWQARAALCQPAAEGGKS